MHYPGYPAWLHGRGYPGCRMEKKMSEQNGQGCVTLCAQRSPRRELVKTGGSKPGRVERSLSAWLAKLPPRKTLSAPSAGPGGFSLGERV